MIVSWATAQDLGTEKEKMKLKITNNIQPN